MKWRLAVLIGIVFNLLGASAIADNVVQGFNSQSVLQIGEIVAIDKTPPNTVKAAPANDPKQIYGVVIDPAQASLTLQQQGQQTYVANSGSYPVLVSTQNGSINAGDYISLSSVDGIGSKATAEQNYVLGRALSSFNGKSGSLTQAAGYAIGRINVSVSPAPNPNFKDSANVPGPLKNLSQTIAGHAVPALQIYAALVLFVVVVFFAAVLLWNGVRSGMTAIGRNPLSKPAIFQGMIRVAILAMMVFIGGLAGVYLILKA